MKCFKYDAEAISLSPTIFDPMTIESFKGVMVDDDGEIVPVGFSLAELQSPLNGETTRGCLLRMAARLLNRKSHGAAEVGNHAC